GHYPRAVVGPPAAAGPQAIDRDDARVFQSAGDLGLDLEPLAADGVVGVVVEDLFQRDLAIQLRVDRYEHSPQPAAGVGPEDAEALAVAGCGSDRVGARAVGAPVGAGAEGGERARDLGAAGAGEGFACRAVHVECREASLGVAAVGLNLPLG